MDLDPRLHFVVVTGIVVKYDGPSTSGHSTELSRSPQGKLPKFLIAKRAAHEKAFPNRWTVPGGKLVRKEYETIPYKTDYPQWYNVVEWVLKKEIKEEVSVEIKNPHYLTDLVFIRPDGYPVVTLSYWCEYVSGEAKAGKDFTDVAWVTAAEAKNYDLIEGIAEEIEDVEKILSY